MATLLNRTLSVLVLFGWAMVAHRLGSLGLMFKIAIPLLLAVACIWFPDELGDYTGVMHYHSITSPTPGGCVYAVGWLILLGLPLLFWYVASASRPT